MPRPAWPRPVTRFAKATAWPAWAAITAKIRLRHFSCVNSLNRYAGPPNLQVAGQPTEGRSGGGLFTSDGLVIGVCNARDPQDQEGFYAALETICAQLDDAHMAFAYQSPKSCEGGSVLLMAAATAPPMTQQTPATVLPVSLPNAVPENSVKPLALAGTPPPGLNPSEQAAMEEIRSRLKEDAEVICVIRSRRNPQAKSEVIMLDRATPELLQQLAAEAQSLQGPQPTSLEVSQPKQPALEWSSNGNSNSKTWCRRAVNNYPCIIWPPTNKNSPLSPVKNSPLPPGEGRVRAAWLSSVT